MTKDAIERNLAVFVSCRIVTVSMLVLRLPYLLFTAVSGTYSTVR